MAAEPGATTTPFVPTHPLPALGGVMGQTALDEACEDARLYHDLWKAAERREARLRAALSFYADADTYEEHPVGAPWDGASTEYPIWEDQGLLARDALG